MFSLNTKTRYAVRALYHLANSTDGKAVTVRYISEEEGLSKKYLEAIFSALRRKKLIKGVRGPIGGYVLSAPPESITLLNVIEAIEGEFSPVSCLTEDPVCKRNNLCKAQPIWQGLQKNIADYLGSIKLTDMLEKGQPECAVTNGGNSKRKVSKNE